MTTNDTAATAAQLSQDIPAIDQASSGGDAPHTAATIIRQAGAPPTETAKREAIKLKSGDSRVIHGADGRLCGDDVVKGLTIEAGNIAIETRTIETARAEGGNGGSGGAGVAHAVAGVRAPRRLKIVDIQKLVASHYRVTRADILSSRRNATLVKPRHVAMYLSKALTLRSLPEIARRFGGRDHTTVLHAVRKIEGLRASNASLRKELELLKRMLQDYGDGASNQA